MERTVAEVSKNFTRYGSKNILLDF